MFKSLARQMYGLLWKNVLIKRRHYISTALEIAIPIALCLLISWASYKISKGKDHAGHRMPPTVSDDIDFDSINIKNKWNLDEKLCFSPDTDDARVIMTNVKQQIDAYLHEPRQLDPHKDEAEVDKVMTSRNGTTQFNCIVFEDLTAVTRVDGSFKYKVKSFMASYNLWEMKTSPGPSSSPPSDNVYLYQYWLNQALLTQRRDKFNLSFTEASRIKTQRIPYPPYVLTSADFGAQILPGFLVYCFIVIFPFTVNRVCAEKSSMSREMLKMNGLTDLSYWTANIGFNFICFALVSLIVVVTMKIPIFGYAMWAYSNFFFLLLGFLLSSLQLILAGMILSVIFQKPKVCTSVAVVFFITSLSLNSFVENKLTDSVASLEKLRWICAAPNMGLVLLLRIISKFEGEAVGITWQTMSAGVDELNGLTYSNILSSMSLSILVLTLLLWYLDAVWPWQPGVAKPLYFLFTKNYWMPSSQENNRDRSMQMRASNGHDAKNSSYFEEDPSKAVAIECQSLRKSFTSLFKSEKKVAVDGLDLNIYHGEITCLLGHNGAGKTTTMNMITGMFTPSSGSITVNGYDLMTQTAQARSSMSLCPQHNPLYDELTVREHLFLYSCIKGYPLSRMRGEIDNALQLTGMLEHCDKFPTQLSGGMKRKLCLGIALVGGSQILILDEPSSGLDTEARRFMWDTLKRVRQNRTILLTTHDMEEADALADRIVIMHEGHAVCSGTSMFLKTKLGTGYSLAISKAQNFDAENTLQLIRKYLPRAAVKSDMGSEITYELKEDGETKKHLSPFFKELETNCSALGINSFGAAVSTLEDVFLKIGEISAGPVKEPLLKAGERHRSDVSLLLEDRLDLSRNTGFSLVISQLVGLFLKRLHHAKRSWKNLIYQIITPCLVFTLGFWLSDTVKSTVDLFTAAHDIGLNLYPETKVIIQTDNSTLSNQFRDYFKIIVGQTNHQLQEVAPTANMADFFISEMKGLLNTRYLKSHVVGVTVKSALPNTTNQYDITAWVNLEATASFSVAMDLIQQTQSLEQLKKNLTDISSGLIQASSQAAYDKQELSYGLMIFSGISWMVFIPLSLTSLAASYVVFPVLEKASKAKLIQLMAGLNPVLLHFGSLLFDLLSHLISSILLIAFLALVDPNKYFVRTTADAFALLTVLMAFGAASIVICYLLSYLFSSDSRAVLLVNIFGVIGGLILSIVIYVLKLLKFVAVIENSTYDLVNNLSRISPIFSITSVFRKIYDNNYAKDICSSIPALQLDCSNITNTFDPKLPCCPDICRDDTRGYDVCTYDSPFGWTGNRILPEFVSNLVVFASFASLIVIYEFFGSEITRLISSLKVTPPRQFADTDVIAEETRVSSLISNGTYREEALTVSQLYKKFKSFFAVRGVSFTVHKHECFGLLGVNGAGKSTTFGMLTGDLTPARGEVYQENINLRKQKRLYQQNLGYCPQFNPIIDNITGIEMIYLFGRLRGISGNLLSLLAEEMVSLVDLQDHASRPSGTYSGGNKRKLSIALAMIGNPKLVLLDEPTAGVDPGARRKIWASLSYIREQLNCSMILTSHSMNECEALCSRMAIMVKGEFVCLGSPQHLKSKFGQGYTVTIKTKRINASNEQYMASFSNIISSKLSGAILVDQSDTVLVYRIDKSAGKLSHLFDQMEHLKQQLDLEDYTLSDTTLEQVFIQFAKQSQSPSQ